MGRLYSRFLKLTSPMSGTSVSRSSAHVNVNTLVELSSRVFKRSSATGRLETPNEAHWIQLRNFLESLRPGDIRCFTPPRNSRHRPRFIRTTTVFQNDDFIICAFFIPTGSRLPLHDHPSMAVVSKVLEGSLSIKTYTRTDHLHRLYEEMMSKGEGDKSHQPISRPTTFRHTKEEEREKALKFHSVHQNGSSPPPPPSQKEPNQSPVSPSSFQNAFADLSAGRIESPEIGRRVPAILTAEDLLSVEEHIDPGEASHTVSHTVSPPPHTATSSPSSYSFPLTPWHSTRVILPLLNNVHELVAVSDCVLLDIIAPPYEASEEPEAFDCRYYSSSSSGSSGESESDQQGSSAEQGGAWFEHLIAVQQALPVSLQGPLGSAADQPLGHGGRGYSHKEPSSGGFRSCTLTEIDVPADYFCAVEPFRPEG
uniref:Uncharacterized protein n=1 Tax=Chromera velia CCMP2878 TaxID=1169474 RepID=A0A0G4FLX8_9ALVE|eukprot:Cvel_17616.t1-p1 / transcript=Cvel_17616.t1 / gene=Cvel_17616 / organism=Chromera_velia_CCMP2878 / gene_product=hypothetical protein / transcript_product=hypothetical protein / location=Cvel_scaffold1417:9892-13140(-) / protein_length=423 / sequence_SO=supercontig / SO=protein_coding / is_pseudo=false